MDNPIKQELVSKRLFELPLCSICHQDLNEELVTLHCGHCYHNQCIRQHLEYTGDCPLCRERANVKQVRRVIYTVIENNATMVHMQSLLMSLDKSEKKQIQQLLLQVKKEHERSEKLVNQNKEQGIEVQKLNKTIQELRIDARKNKDYSTQINQQNVKLNIQIVRAKQQLDDELKIRAQLELTLRNYQKHEKDYERYRHFKNVMSKNSSDLVKYKQELEQQQRSADERADAFFELLLVRNLDHKKIRQEKQQIEDDLRVKEEKMESLKRSVEKLRKELKETSEKRVEEKRKMDELKAKYLTLRERARQGGIREGDIPDADDNSQSFRMKKNPHIPQDPVIQAAIRAPSSKQIGGGVKFGGFKKPAQEKITSFM